MATWAMSGTRTGAEMLVEELEVEEEGEVVAGSTTTSEEEEGCRTVDGVEVA